MWKKWWWYAGMHTWTYQTSELFQKISNFSNYNESNNNWKSKEKNVKPIVLSLKAKRTNNIVGIVDIGDCWTLLNFWKTNIWSEHLQ